MLSFGGQIRRGEKYIWSGEASQVYDGHNNRQVFDRVKGLSSGTELNRFDEAGEAALGKLSGKTPDIIRR